MDYEGHKRFLNTQPRPPSAAEVRLKEVAEYEAFLEKYRQQTEQLDALLTILAKEGDALLKDDMTVESYFESGKRLNDESIKQDSIPFYSVTLRQTTYFKVPSGFLGLKETEKSYTSMVAKVRVYSIPVVGRFWTHERGGNFGGRQSGTSFNIPGEGEEGHFYHPGGNDPQEAADYLLSIAALRAYPKKK